MQNNLNISVNSGNSFKDVESTHASEARKMFRAIIHNVASAFGILVILISVLFIFSEKASAQAFVCTDIAFSDDFKITHPYRMRRIEKDLGTIVNLEEYDKYIRLKIIDSESDKSDAIIMERQPNGTYLYVTSERNGDKAILSIDKVLGYYKGLKLEIWKDNKLSYTVILKRK